MRVYEYGKADADKVLIQPVGKEELPFLNHEFALITRDMAEPLRLIAFEVENWNFELSPWKAPAVFGKEEFGDGAADTLAEIQKYCDDKSKTYYIGGYSLAGLFALWAAYHTDLFKGVAAVSPSIWFPDFLQYMKNNKIQSANVYLSLGDKEEKTRNKIMATVGERIREAYQTLKDNGVNGILEWNAGNHFKDADIRTASGFIWLLEKS